MGTQPVSSGQSSGIVAAVRTLDGRQLVQITAPISPGSSGGPVFNAKGEVFGVAAGMMDKGQNLNFAVPVSLAQRLLLGAAATAGAPNRCWNNSKHVVPSGVNFNILPMPKDYPLKLYSAPPEAG